MPKRINEYIWLSKQRKKKNDNLKAKKDLELMSKLNNRMMDEIDISLKEIEKQIDRLLK